MLGICAGEVSLTWGIPNKETDLFCFAVICPAVLIMFAGGVFLAVRESRQSFSQTVTSRIFLCFPAIRPLPCSLMQIPEN